MRYPPIDDYALLADCHSAALVSSEGSVDWACLRRFGRARVLDAFAMRPGGSRVPYNQLLRVIEGVEGRVEFDVRIEPRFDYGERRPWLRYHGDTGAYSAVGVTAPS